VTALYDKDKRRLLYLANRENCLAKMKEYRDNNKEKILSLREIDARTANANWAERVI
jgi:hypothetical protein